MIDLASKVAESAAKEIRRLAEKGIVSNKTGKFGVTGSEMIAGYVGSAEIAEQVIQDWISNQTGKKAFVINGEKGIQEYGDPTSEETIIIIIDPLGGSSNLRPWRTPGAAVAVSVALGSLRLIGKVSNFNLINTGAVIDVFREQLYVATRGHGATVRSFGKIHSSPQKTLRDAIIGVDLGNQGQHFDSIYWHIDQLLHHAKCQRRSGSSILDFVKVACGEYDAHVSFGGKLKIFDLAAAKLIVEEAGGVFEIIDSFSDNCHIKQLFDSKDNALLSKFRYRAIASGNATLHREIKDLIV